MRFLLALLLVVAAGCNVASPPSQSSRAFEAAAPALQAMLSPGTFTDGKISHVVIIIQENRTPDDLFYGLKGADTQSYGTNSAGTRINLTPEPLTAPYDLSHTQMGMQSKATAARWTASVMERDSDCKGRPGCPTADLAAYGYVPRKEVQPYFDMAEQYAFADRMFETNEGPSFPAHQYLISGTSTISQGSTLARCREPIHG